MRWLAIVLLVACGSVKTPVKTVRPDLGWIGETVAVDTPKTTADGNRFTLPKDWTMTVKGPATILSVPEGDSWFVLVDVKTTLAEHARDLAWLAYTRDMQTVTDTQPRPDLHGWSRITHYDHTTVGKRYLATSALFANDTWTVAIIDFAAATGITRDSQLSLVVDSLMPKGFEPESFAGKAAHVLDEERVAQLTSFVEDSMRTLEIPGVALGLIADGKVVFSGGFGVRELGKPEKPDGDTKFMIASNTKPFTTLMLAKLVDDHKLRWDQPATSALPAFELGDPEVTRKVQIKHLLCACTGIPREDERFRYRFRDRTAADVLVELGRTQPTTRFGELFQYSNVIAAAAGFIGGHVAFPELELGTAYDEAMRTLVWEPLGMTSTTFDFRRAQTGNFATPHAQDPEGKTVAASNEVNEYMIPLRPAAGAWSSVNDLLKYIQMELAEGMLPDGTRYIGKPALFARREKQIAIDGTSVYGMGLMIDRASGIEVEHHGGYMFGFHSDMMWIPALGIGAVVLTNSDLGDALRSQFRRRLLEVLFDGKPEAAARVAQQRKWFDEDHVWSLTVPADPAAVAKLAPRYENAMLGTLTVLKRGDKTIFDFGDFQSEVATRTFDGTTMFVALTPELSRFQLIVRGDTLVSRSSGQVLTPK